jgi:outer membrane protein assembly factor BamB
MIDAVIPVSPTDTTKVVDFKWNTTIDTKGLVGNAKSVHYKDWYIISDDIKKPAGLLAFNKTTGKKEWEWHSSTFKNIQSMSIKDNIFIGSTFFDVFALNLDTRVILWSENIENQGFSTDHEMTVTDKDIYITWLAHKVWRNQFDSLAIYKYNIQSGHKEKIYGFGIEENRWWPECSKVSFWQDPISKDSILLVNKTGWNDNASPQESPTDFYAINIRTKKVMWRQEKYSSVPSDFTYAPVVYNDDVLVGGDWSIYSFNIPTGKLNWRTQFPQLGNFGCFSGSQHMVVGDRFFINDPGYDFICLNAKTGDKLWHNTTDAPNCTETKFYYKDMIVIVAWGNGSIVVLDAFTGKKIYQQKPPDHSTFYADMSYDQSKDMFFAHTFNTAYGFKINKPK